MRGTRGLSLNLNNGGGFILNGDLGHELLVSIRITCGGGLKNRCMCNNDRTSCPAMARLRRKLAGCCAYSCCHVNKSVACSRRIERGEHVGLFTGIMFSHMGASSCSCSKHARLSVDLKYGFWYCVAGSVLRGVHGLVAKDLVLYDVLSLQTRAFIGPTIGMGSASFTMVASGKAFRTYRTRLGTCRRVLKVRKLPAFVMCGR